MSENNNQEMITITKAEYDRLLKDQDWLACLEAAGVDNWHHLPTNKFAGLSETI